MLMRSGGPQLHTIDSCQMTQKWHGHVCSCDMSPVSIQHCAKLGSARNQERHPLTYKLRGLHWTHCGAAPMDHQCLGHSRMGRATLPLARRALQPGGGSPRPRLAGASVLTLCRHWTAPILPRLILIAAHASHVTASRLWRLRSATLSPFSPTGPSQRQAAGCCLCSGIDQSARGSRGGDRHHGGGGGPAEGQRGRQAAFAAGR